MAIITKSSVGAIMKETTEGSLLEPASGADFVPLRAGFQISGALESINSDEMVAGSIGASKSYTTKEVPTASFPVYFKHSGTEGVAPEAGDLYEASLGAVAVASTEYNTVAGSTTTVINVDTGEGASYQVGEALLIKDATNNYSIRHIASISSDALTLNFALDTAPGTAVNLGKCVLYYPDTSLPTLSLHHYQATSGAKFKEAVAGVRVSSLSLEFPANDFASATAELAGIAYYYNQIRITTGSNDAIDFNDGGGQENATLSAGLYNPHELAREVQSKMDTLTADNITVSYSDTTGKFTIASDGGTLSLLWNTGTNTATTAGGALGFAVAADDTGATSYVSDNAQDRDPAYTPSYDSATNVIVKGGELLIGDQADSTCRKATNVSISIETPKTDVDSICAATGVSESVVLERTVTMSATLVLQEHEVDLFDKFKNSTTTQAQFTAGSKSASNWEAGKCFSVWLGNATITANTISDSDGYRIVEFEAKAHVTDLKEDVYLAFV